MLKNNKGMTLIELIIVIALLGVLSMIGTTMLMIVIHRAEDVRDEANLRTTRINGMLVDIFVEDPLSNIVVPSPTKTSKNNGWVDPDHPGNNPYDDSGSLSGDNSRDNDVNDSNKGKGSMK